MVYLYRPKVPVKPAKPVLYHRTDTPNYQLGAHTADTTKPAEKEVNEIEQSFAVNVLMSAIFVAVLPSIDAFSPEWFAATAGLTTMMYFLQKRLNEKS